jgi:hydrogenase maturation factor
MTEEDEEFNRIEREATLRLKAVSAALKDHQDYLLKRMSEYERGVIEGRQMQAQSSVDKAVNALSKRKWVGLTRAERVALWELTDWSGMPEHSYGKAIEKLLKEKNEM